MFRRIVVGADGSSEGHDAVVLGAALAEATGAGLTLLRAFPPLLLGSGEGLTRGAQMRENERELWTERRRFAPDAHAEVVADANPARALSAHARRWRADLIVVGSSPSASPGHCAIGRTGRQLLGRMPPAIAIAQRGLHDTEVLLMTIAVGYDGSVESSRALSFADELAAAAHADLRIHTVGQAPIPVLLHGEPSPPTLLAELRESARRSASQLARRGAASTIVAPRVEASVGDAGEILRAASERAELTVIGLRRWGTFARVVLGGVGERLAGDCGGSLVITVTADRPMATA